MCQIGDGGDPFDLDLAEENEEWLEHHEDQTR